MKIIIAVILLSLSTFSYAGDVEEILEGKEVEFQGVCSFNAKNELVFTKKDAVKQYLCVVGFENAKSPKRWVGLVDEKGYHTIILIDIKTMVQKVLWKRGNTSV